MRFAVKAAIRRSPAAWGSGRALGHSCPAAASTPDDAAFAEECRGAFRTPAAGVLRGTKTGGHRRPQWVVSDTCQGQRVRRRRDAMPRFMAVHPTAFNEDDVRASAARKDELPSALTWHSCLVATSDHVTCCDWKALDAQMLTGSSRPMASRVTRSTRCDASTRPRCRSRPREDRCSFPRRDAGRPRGAALPSLTVSTSHERRRGRPSPRGRAAGAVPPRWALRRSRRPAAPLLSRHPA